MRQARLALREGISVQLWFAARHTGGVRVHRIQLPGKHHRDHLFGLRQIELALAEGLVCRLESLVIRLLVLGNLIGNCFFAGQHRSDLAAKDQIRRGTGGPPLPSVNG